MKILKQYGLTEAQLIRILAGKKFKPKIIRKHITEKSFSFGIVSDTHFGSAYAKLNELHTFYQICHKENISNVFHCGDILQGQKMFGGWENETSVFGAENQVKYCIDNYPHYEEITTYFITGNHCLSFYRQAGVDVGVLIAERRKDLQYIGQYQADIFIGGIKIRLIHPSGGMPYALSYRGQKLAEQISSGQKPQILAIGHLHTNYYFFYRNIHIFGCGAFEGQTPYLLRKGVNPSLGGWIVKVRTANDTIKSIVSCTVTWIPFYEKEKK